MKKFAPELHRWACELNERDGFRMRHERRPGERLPGGSKSDSSDSSSSDSSSDEAQDVVRLEDSALEYINAGIEAAAAAPRKRKRLSGWDAEPAPVNQDLEFSVTLEKDWAKESQNELGVDIATDTMAITNVSNALVSKWNADNPESILKVNDCIVGVNGIRGSSDALVAELRSAQTLKMLL